MKKSLSRAAAPIADIAHLLFLKKLRLLFELNPIAARVRVLRHLKVVERHAKLAQDRVSKVLPMNHARELLLSSLLLGLTTLNVGRSKIRKDLFSAPPVFKKKKKTHSCTGNVYLEFAEHFIFECLVLLRHQRRQASHLPLQRATKEGNHENSGGWSGDGGPPFPPPRLSFSSPQNPTPPNGIRIHEPWPPERRDQSRAPPRSRPAPTESRPARCVRWPAESAP